MKKFLDCGDERHSSNTFYLSLHLLCIYSARTLYLLCTYSAQRTLSHTLAAGPIALFNYVLRLPISRALYSSLALGSVSLLSLLLGDESLILPSLVLSLVCSSSSVALSVRMRSRSCFTLCSRSICSSSWCCVFYTFHLHIV